MIHQCHGVDWILFGIIIMSSFACYFPAIFHLEIQASLNSFELHEIHHTLLASIAVVFPLAIDVIFNRDLHGRMMMSRWLLLVAFLIPNSLIYISLLTKFLLIDTLVICGTKARQILVCGALLAIYNDQRQYQQIIRRFLSVFTSMNALCTLFAMFSNSHNSRFFGIVGVISGLLFVIGTFALCGNCFDILRKRQTPFTFFEKYSLINSSLLVFVLVARLAGYIYFKSSLSTSYSQKGLLYLLIIETVAGVLSFVLPTRMAIEEASYARVSSHLLSINFIRSSTKLRRTLSAMSGEYPQFMISSFCSHEVRTPLNTLTMGLQLLLTHDIFQSLGQPPPSTRPHSTSQPVSPTSGCPRCQHHHLEEAMREAQRIDALDLLQSMKQSCETAVSTLNDVLLFDKIEAGKMQLEKRQIEVVQLLSQTIKPFSIQVSVPSP